jgi:hypothetical protein
VDEDVDEDDLALFTVCRSLLGTQRVLRIRQL